MPEALQGVRPPLEEIYGTLPDWAIKEYIKSGRIKIEPLPENWEAKVGPVTIDFRLGGPILVPKRTEDRYVDVKRGVDDTYYDRIELSEGQVHLMAPQQFIIAPTMESLELPDDVMGILGGRSSLARLGIVVHLSSGRFDPGWNGKPILELKNNSSNPVMIYGAWPICSFSFEKLMASVDNPYTQRGRYTGSNVHSLIHEDNQRQS